MSVNIITRLWHFLRIFLDQTNDKHLSCQIIFDSIEPRSLGKINMVKSFKIPRNTNYKTFRKEITTTNNQDIRTDLN